jgi:hypothetical protein
MRILTVFILLASPVMLFSQSILTKFEQTQGKETPTYSEIVSWWKMMDGCGFPAAPGAGI